MKYWTVNGQFSERTTIIQLPQECLSSDPCCEPVGCKLKVGAECYTGDCCQDCRFVSYKTACRPASSECDLGEFCTGTHSQVRSVCLLSVLMLCIQYTFNPRHFKPTHNSLSGNFIFLKVSRWKRPNTP